MKQGMMKTLFGMAIIFLLHPWSATLAVAQTRLLPDNTLRDPRMTVIRNKLQSDHGSVRPLTTYLDMEINRSWGQQGFFHSTLQGLLLEAGAEPVSSERNAQFQLYLASSGRLESGVIVETLTLTLTDLRAGGGGGQLIMSASSTLQCPDTRTLRYHSLVCPMNKEILAETFLRLR